MRKRLSSYLSRLRPYFRSAGIIVLVLALAVVWYFFLWQPASALLDPKDRVTAQDEAFRTLLQLIGGAAILFGGYTAWRTLRATQRTVEATEKQVEATQKQVEIAREGQITERFNKAVEHLGSDDLTIRLGGIYALERIAEDSETHHWPVMEVLTAFVRENAPRKQEAEHPERKVGSTASIWGEMEPRTDIQAILTVIGRRSTKLEKADQFLDLRGTELRGANLFEANLCEANLNRANLREANLSGANLQRASLIWTNLHWANLRGATLRGARLTGANLCAAYLGDADLREAYLHRVNLEGVYTVDEDGNRHLVTNEELAVAKSLEGATMPDGSKHA